MGSRKRKMETAQQKCSFCKREITPEFSPKKKSSFCTRQDCRKARRAQKKIQEHVFIEEGPVAPALVGDESEFVPALPRVEEDPEVAAGTEPTEENDTDLKEAPERQDTFTEAACTAGVRFDEYGGALDEGPRVEVVTVLSDADLDREDPHTGWLQAPLFQIRIQRSDGKSDHQRLFEKTRETLSCPAPQGEIIAPLSAPSSPKSTSSASSDRLYPLEQEPKWDVEYDEHEHLPPRVSSRATKDEDERTKSLFDLRLADMNSDQAADSRLCCGFDRRQLAQVIKDGRFWNGLRKSAQPRRRIHRKKSEIAETPPDDNSMLTESEA